MYLVYADESGDSGLINSPTNYFVLACVMIHESLWLSNLDALIALRRDLKKTYGIPVRDELKAKHIRYGRGPMKALKMSPIDREGLYKELLDYQANKLNVVNFGVAVYKKTAAKYGFDPREMAWENAIERVNRYCTDYNERAFLLPDEGHGHLIRRIVRKARRHHIVAGHYGGNLKIPSQLLVEDPVNKQSHESYFVQLADWNAYAAMRSKYVDPGKALAAPTWTELWDPLGPTLLLDVNKLSGGPPGMVLRK